MVCEGDISETLYDPRLLLWVVMGWADCTRGDLEHSCLLNSCSTWVDEVGRNSLAGVHEDPIATSTSPRRKRVICKPYKPSNHDGVVSHKAGGLASRGLSGPYIKFFVNGMEGCSSSLKSCRSQRADMGAYFLILRLAHRGVVHDDELFPTVFAGSTSCGTIQKSTAPGTSVILWQYGQANMAELEIVGKPQRENCSQLNILCSKVGSQDLRPFNPFLLSFGRYEVHRVTKKNKELRPGQFSHEDWGGADSSVLVKEAHSLRSRRPFRCCVLHPTRKGQTQCRVKSWQSSHDRCI